MNRNRKLAHTSVSDAELTRSVGGRAASRIRAAWAGWRHSSWSLQLGSLLLLLVAAVAGLGPLLFPGDPWAMAGPPMLWPGDDPAFPLGTDIMGRDLATGLVSGAKVSLLVGAVSTLMASVVGVLVGALAGFHGGLVDRVLMRVVELFQIVPHFVLAVVLVAVFEPSVTTAIVAIAVVSWPATARLVRSEFLSLREREFVLAARTLGMGDLRLIATQLLPNALPPVLVVALLSVATAILTEASLAFLGLGDPNVMSWGTLIGAGREQIVDAWYVCALPGAAIVVTVLAINLVGEGLTDRFNPRLSRR
ncbi:ABC transporter permease [Comamonas serinivorans]|uniref:ABC transporter permease n=1 Tax=Comamonas serinivorans TaxID=1082851 RepID=A0A1Y0ENF3_9BURK|nr:ABC transporter permease [Comamonas serinivorans]